MIQAYKDRIRAVVAEKLATYQDHAKAIYERPEVCNTEYFASDLLAKQLRQEGFEVTQNIAGHETGFVGVYRASKPGPVLAFLAEYDALPGIGHACGHNLFGNYSLLAAVALKAVIDDLGGEIRVYGTPGEEGGENGSAKDAYILATEKVGASIPGMGGMVMGNIVSTLLVLPFPFFITGNHLEKAITDPALLGLGFVMGLLASALPALGEVSALRMLPSNVYSVVLSLEPAFAAIVGIFMLAENTGLIRWAAIALLISASIGITLSHARAERAALAAGKRESIEPYLPGAVDNIGASIAQMTGAIELPTPEQVAADKARRQGAPGKTHSRTGEEG